MLEYTGRSLGLRPPEGYGKVETDGGYSQTYTVQGFAYQFQDQDENDFYFIPQSAINQGIVAYDRQYYFPNVLRPDFLDKFQGESVTLDQIGDQRFARDVSRYYEDTQGVIVSKPVFDDLFKKTSSYDIQNTQYDGVRLGPITGVGQKDGKNVYVTAASGRDNPQGWIDWRENENQTYRNTSWYDPGNKLLRNLSYGLLLLSGAGFAGFGPLAVPSAGATAGTAAGSGLLPSAGGTTGLLPSAAGVTGITAPAGFTLAPGIVAPAAGAGLAVGADLGSVGQTGLTPGAAGEGLLAPTTPGISSMGGAQGITVPVSGGTVTSAGLIPAGAVPVLGDPSSFINDPNVLGQPVIPTETGMGVTDALRAANAVRNLLGAQQNPIVPQQARPQMAARGVDTLALPQLTARTPGVSSLLAPAQLQARYQSTLLPNVFSLLG